MHTATLIMNQSIDQSINQSVLGVSNAHREVHVKQNHYSKLHIKKHKNINPMNIEHNCTNEIKS